MLLHVLLKFEIIIASLVALLLNILWIPVIDFITYGKYGSVNRYTVFLLSLSMPFIYANNFLWSINFAQGRLKMIFQIFFITFFINVSGDIILIPFFSGEGAAVAYLLAIVMQFIIFWITTDLPQLQENKFIFLIPIAAIAGAAVPLFIFEQTWLILIMSLCFFFLLLFFMKFLGKKDWPLLKRIATI